MTSRLLTPVRKLDVPAMGLHIWDKFVFSMRLMLIVSTKPALVCSMASQQLRIFLSMGQMFQMPLLRLLHRNRGFISDRIRHFMSGGPSTRNTLQFLTATWFQSYPLCRDTQSHRAFGKSMLTQYYVNLAWHQRFMNLAYIRGLSMANKLY